MGAPPGGCWQVLCRAPSHDPTTHRQGHDLIDQQGLSGVPGSLPSNAQRTCSIADYSSSLM